MNFNWKLLLFGTGFALLIEGFLYSISPQTIKEVARQVMNFENKTIRYIGIAAFIIGGVFLILYKYLQKN